MSIDWRAIFKRYAQIVGYNEGVYLLDDSEWTPEEWKAIQVALNEAEKEKLELHNRQRGVV